MSGGRGDHRGLRLCPYGGVRRRSICDRGRPTPAAFEDFFFCEVMRLRTSASAFSSSFSVAVRICTTCWRMVSRSSTIQHRRCDEDIR